MKKFITTLVSAIIIGCFAGYAQSVHYQTNFFSMAEWNSKTNLFDWSDWVASDHIPIIVSDKNIRIYTEELQNYDIFNQIREGDDGTGYFVDYSAVDQKGSDCIVKIREQRTDNVMQICIYYYDMAWAYCIEKVETIERR